MKSVLRNRVRLVNQVFPLKIAITGITFLFALSLLIKTLESLRRYRDLSSPTNWSLLEQRLKGPLGQSNPQVINYIRTHGVIISPASPSEPYVLENPTADPSLGQSILVKKIFENKRKGFFVECGAYDGETRSNTLSLERDLGWTGLLLEADRANFDALLKKKRKAWSSLSCLSTHGYPYEAQLLLNGSMSRQWADSLTYHLVRGNFSHLNFDRVQCYPLYSLLLALDINAVDYLSLDVEGSEFEILATIPFKKLRIKLLSVEITHGAWRKNTSQILTNLMSRHGYRLVTRLIANNSFANDLIFAHPYLLDLKYQFPQEVYYYQNNVVNQYAQPV